MRLKTELIIFLKRIRTVPVLLLLTAFTLSAYSEPVQKLSPEEISQILVSSPEDARDLSNTRTAASAVRELFSHSIQKIAAQGFKTTKYILEEPVRDVAAFFRALTEKSAGAPSPVNFPEAVIPVPNQLFKALPLLLLSFIIAVAFSGTLAGKIELTPIKFHFLIPLRV